LARISTYVIDGTIVDDDKVIGSDADNSMITKNYRIGDLVAYFAVSIGDYLVPYNNATDDVDLGPFSLFTNDIYVNDKVYINGNSGLVGQALLSQGGGAATWGYITGTQTLSNVLTNGNLGDRSIILENANSVVASDIDGTYDPKANVYVRDKVGSNIGQLFSNSLQLQNSTLGRSGSYFSNEIVYTESTFGNTVTIKPSTFGNQTFIYPNVGGAFVMSVNGTLADLSGNVTIPVGPGGSSSLQQVVDIGNGISNFGGSGTASIQSTNFTNNRTLYLNDDAYPTIRLVDNANASNFLQIDVDTLILDGVSYNWSSIVNPPTSPLVALPFTTDHLAATNNQYVIGDIVWYLGDVYRCIANNDSILPTSTLYWTNLGAGFPLVQQPADWNSTSGNNQILNKPAISSIGFEMNFLLMGA